MYELEPYFKRKSLGLEKYILTKVVTPKDKSQCMREKHTTNGVFKSFFYWKVSACGSFLKFQWSFWSISYSEYRLFASSMKLLKLFPDF